MARLGMLGGAGAAGFVLGPALGGIAGEIGTRAALADIAHHRPAQPRIGRRPVIVAMLHLLGLLAMLWTYFGVNLLLPSLHSYA